MYWYIIPARKGSKGLPFKNRTLFEFTASSLPIDVQSNVIVTSDDEVVLEMAEKYNFIPHKRCDNLAEDTTSIKEVIKDVIKKFKIEEDDKIVLLYLTYPEREWKDISRAISFYKSHKAKSLLCKKEITVSPYLCYYEEPAFKGTKIIEHDLCRRQDYRKCFEASHFISILNASAIEQLDTNLHCKDTIFLPIKSFIDVDEEKDLRKYYNEN